MDPNGGKLLGKRAVAPTIALPLARARLRTG
jgi:hypothetical protein